MYVYTSSWNQRQSCFFPVGFAHQKLAEDTIRWIPQEHAETRYHIHDVLVRDLLSLDQLLGYIQRRGRPHHHHLLEVERPIPIDENVEHSMEI